jgi:hypothetical protein
MFTSEDKSRLEELIGKGELAPEEQEELTVLQGRQKAAIAAELAGEEGPLPNKEEAKPSFDKEESKPSFDKEGASSVVTMRDSKAVQVWFKDGKEIGVENAG